MRYWIDQQCLQNNHGYHDFWYRVSILRVPQDPKYLKLQDRRVPIVPLHLADCCLRALYASIHNFPQQHLVINIEALWELSLDFNGFQWNRRFCIELLYLQLTRFILDATFSSCQTIDRSRLLLFLLLLCFLLAFQIFHELIQCVSRRFHVILQRFVNIIGCNIKIQSTFWSSVVWYNDAVSQWVLQKLISLFAFDIVHTWKTAFTGCCREW